MKSILIHLEDEEYEMASIAKGNDSWKDMLLLSVRNKDTKNTNPLINVGDKK